MNEEKEVFETDFINSSNNENDTKDKWGFKNSLDYILENYDEVSRKTHSVSKEKYTNQQSELFKLFVYDFPDYLKKLSICISAEFNVSWSHREGTLMVLPYYSLSFDDEENFFVYYLFSYDSSDIYLTLGLKTEGKQINFNRVSKIFKKLILKHYRGTTDLNFDIIDEIETVNLKVNELYSKQKSETDAEKKRKK